VVSTSLASGATESPAKAPKSVEATPAVRRSV